MSDYWNLAHGEPMTQHPADPADQARQLLNQIITHAAGGTATDLALMAQAYATLALADEQHEANRINRQMQDWMLNGGNPRL